MLSIGINEKYQYYADKISRDFDGKIVFLSYVGYQNNIEQSMRDLKKDGKCQFQNVSYNFYPLNEYIVQKHYDSITDLTHIVLLRNSFMAADYPAFYMHKEAGALDYDLFYEKANMYSPIPLKKEWAPFIYESLVRNNCVSVYTVNNCGDTNAPKSEVVRIDLNQTRMTVFLGEALKNGTISIDKTKEVSLLTSETSLDSYTQEYCETLADKISNSFTPVYDPVMPVGNYPFSALNDFEDFCYDSGKQNLQLYEAQKSMIMACASNLNTEHLCFVNGECGSGKTLLGSGITYVHGKQLGYTALVMCPAQLVKKWRREILRSVPNARCHIIKRISDIMKLDESIRDKDKKYNLYLIFSQESAKFSYNKMPNVKYSQIQKAFLCPCCGQILKKVENDKTSKRKAKRFVNMTSGDFKKESKKIGNLRCSNEVEYYDWLTHTTVKKRCGASLWSPIVKRDENPLWIKAGKAGWFYASEVQAKYDALVKKEVLSKKERESLVKLDEYLNDEGRIVAPTRFSLSQYLLRYYKKQFDYFICDEVHELLAEDSLKANSFGDLVRASKNTICLTGTLINGYASSLFYLLYRIIPRRMKTMGFEYSDVNKFMNRYGSSKEIRDVETNTPKQVPMPGVSPLLFTDYLLDICAFISLDDVADGLPGYKEIPVDCHIDKELEDEYDRIKQSYLDNTGFKSHEKSGKASSQYLQLFNMYPDQPFNMDPIINPENNAVLFEPKEFPNKYNDKLEKTLELIQRKVAEGEKVLIYYRWTNKTNVAKSIGDRLKEVGIKYAELKTSTVAKEKREEWLAKQKENIDVLICNPKLVATGLDLFEYTTIIWYQLTDDVLTMRQASRRSWRLGQQKDVEVYFMYFANTVQETLLSLMSGKLQASLSIEGKCSEENLSVAHSMEDMTTQLTNSLIKGISHKVDMSSFDKSKKIRNGETNHATHIIRYRKSREELAYRKPIASVTFAYRTNLARQCASSDTTTFFNLLNNGNVLKLFC